jgi:hypothetical protein
VSVALKDFGKAEHDPGQWVDFGLDKPFRLRIRRIPSDVWDEIDKRHRGKESFEVRDGVRRRVQDGDSMVESLQEKASWAWTDAEGLEVEIAHEEASKLWTKLVGRELSVGEALVLAGDVLTTAVKKRVLTHLRPIARVELQDIGSFVVLEAARMQKEFASGKEAEAKNS